MRKCLQAFQPQFLLMFAGNVQMEFTSLDGGVERSFTGISWPFHFCTNADPSKGQREAVSVKNRKYAQKHYIPSFDLLLRAVDDMFLAHYTDTIILPRPHSVQQATNDLL